MFLNKINNKSIKTNNKFNNTNRIFKTNKILKLIKINNLNKGFKTNNFMIKNHNLDRIQKIIYNKYNNNNKI